MNNTKRRILITGGSGFIGTNYIEFLTINDPKASICNLDNKPPQIDAHAGYWKSCDIREYEQTQQIIDDFNPTEVVHLAARTDTDSENLEDYSANSIGSDNLIQALKQCDTISKAIITSTQFVKRPGTEPEDDCDYDPHTAYGHSKVYMERATRAANLQCAWTIIRPTNIWGPWHPRYPHEFWKVLDRGLYFHPSGPPVRRCYGYVNNVIFQIEKILHSDPSAVDRKVFYVGDDPIDLADWVNGFSQALTNKPTRVLPRWFIRSLALAGDVLGTLGIKFPITTSRFRSMTTDDLAPMQATFDAFGTPPTNLTQGINQTAEWLKKYGYISEVFELSE